MMTEDELVLMEQNAAGAGADPLATDVGHLVAEVRQLRAQLAAVKRKRRFMVGPVPPIAEQAKARGEEVPVGKTLAEIAALGYQVPADVAEFAVLHTEPESPTGFCVGIKAKDIDRLYAEATDLKAVETCGYDRDVDGEHLFGEKLVTAGWLRKHKLALLDKFTPNWATVSQFEFANGYMVGVYWERTPACAPTPAAWKDESERRVAAGLPPLEDWRCPSMWRGFVRRMRRGAEAGMEETYDFMAAGFALAYMTEATKEPAEEPAPVAPVAEPPGEKP